MLLSHVVLKSSLAKFIKPPARLPSRQQSHSDFISTKLPQSVSKHSKHSFSRCRNRVKVLAKRGSADDKHRRGASKKRKARPPRQLHCEHFDSCSGCTEVLPDRPPVFEEAKAFFEHRGYRRLRLVAGPVHSWRCRARLAVRGRASDVKLGLFEARSHNVVDIPTCSIHHPRINAAAEAVRAAANSLAVQPYSEFNGQGQLRYLQLTAAGRESCGYRADRDAGAPIQVSTSLF